MATIIIRIIKYGLQGLWRSISLSIASVLVMFLALSIFLGLTLFGALGETALVNLQDKIDITVYFKSSAPEDEILKVEQAVESLAEVKKVEYVSRDQALTNFKEANKDNETISRALDGLLEDNPLLASLNIKAKNPKDYGVIADHLKNDSIQQLVEKVDYAQNQPVIERLVAIINTAERTGLALTIFLAFVAGIVVFSTISLTIYSNREEIGIMRLVGAPNYLIRGPFIFEGVVYGVLAALICMVIAIPIISSIAPYVDNALRDQGVPIFRIWIYFVQNFGKLLAYETLFGVFLGAVSSFVAVRRYLRT